MTFSNLFCFGCLDRINQADDPFCRAVLCNYAADCTFKLLSVIFNLLRVNKL